MFSDEFLNNLPENPYEAALKMSKKFSTWYFNTRNVEPSLTDFYDDFVDAYAAIEVFINATGLPFSALTLGEDHSQNIELIFQLFKTTRDELEKKVERASHAANSTDVRISRDYIMQKVGKLRELLIP